LCGLLELTEAQGTGKRQGEGVKATSRGTSHLIPPDSSAEAEEIILLQNDSRGRVKFSLDLCLRHPVHLRAAIGEMPVAQTGKKRQLRSRSRVMI
jgi:hypothetical protein